MVSPQMVLFWLSKARTVWVAYWKWSIGASVGRSWSPTKKMKSRRGCNWNVLQCKVHLVYSHDLR